MNYQVRPNWDTCLLIAFNLGNVGVHNSGYTLNTKSGLTYEAVDGVAGAPVPTPGRYIQGALVHNAASGEVYRNTGTTATPTWATV